MSVNSSNIDSGKRILQKSIFLFGAGATRDAGCLVSNEMLNDIYKLDLITPELEAIDFLLSSLQYHASWKNLKERKGVSPKDGHQPNIEDLMLLIRRIVNRDSYLPFPITGSWADKINFLETEWRTSDKYKSKNEKTSLFQNLEDIITKRLYEWLKIGNEDLSYLNPLEDFIKQTSGDELQFNFFTLNYDLVFEKFFNKEDDSILTTGFISGAFSGLNNRNGTHRVNYFKLHGSINWEKDEGGLIRERFIYSNDCTRIQRKISKDEIEDVSTDDFLKTPPANPHIIFGHGGKFLSVDPFISLLYYFKEYLSKSEVCFVVGYSFFDPYINNLLLEGLSKDTKKLMVVVNPKFNEMDLLTDEEIKLEPEDKEILLKNRFIDYIQKVQRSAYLSELPSFNLTEISPNKIKIIPSKSSAFFADYFSNSAVGFQKLEDEINAFENEGNIF